MPILTDKRTDSPTIDDLASKAESAYQRRKSRRNERHGTQAADPEVKPAQTAGEIPLEKMLGIARWVSVGTLQLRLVCPALRKAGAIQEEIYRAWPDVIVFSAFLETQQGIDPESVADLWTQSRNALASQAGVPPPEPVTPDDVRSEMRGLQMRLIAKEEDLTILCDSLWKLAHVTPGLHWPRPSEEDPTPLPEGEAYLDDALLDNLSMADYPTLLNVVFDVLGGFTGSFRDRFS